MTSEYVSLGHPDKIADYISEYILDKYMEQDRETRFAVEVQIKDNWVSLAGEVTSRANYTSDQLTQFVKEAIEDIGYTHQYATEWGEGKTLDASRVEVTIHISQQSKDIAQGVDNEGWGDQGIFWGMAVNDPEHDYMPLDHWYARKIGKHLYDKRYGGLDIKTQVTVVDGQPKQCIIAIPIKDDWVLCSDVVKSTVHCLLGVDCDVIVNGTGQFVTHSTFGDCGTTGRKLAVDFYGGNCRIGGGSPWTKDPTKADLTLNLYARKIAKDYLIKNNTPRCYVAISCCIGKRDITIEIYDEYNVLLKRYTENNPPKNIIKLLGLDKVKFAELCKNGLTYGNN